MKKALFLPGLFFLIINGFAQKPKLVLPIGHTDKVNTAQFSPDGSRIVTASGDKTAKIWDAETGKLLADLTGHSNAVYSANFSPNGKKIVTSSVDNTAKIWDAQTGKLLADLVGHTRGVNSAFFSPDGKKIVTGSYDSTAKIWDTETGKLLVDLTGHSSSVISANFSPNAKKIATASDDKTAKIWNSETGKLLANLAGHSREVISAYFSPDGKKIVTASDDKTAKIWDAGTGKLLADLTGHIYSEGFYSTGVTSANFSTDGKKIVTISRDIVKIWDTETGKLLADLTGHSRAVNSAFFSPDGKKIVTASEDETAKIWNAETGELLLELIGHSDGVNSANFSPDGKKIVTSSADKTAKIWDTQTGKFLSDLAGHTSWVHSATFSPDGKKIVTASSDKTAKIWVAQSGKLLTVLTGHSYLVYYANFSPDGKKIITISDDKTSKIWDAENGKLLADLTGHSEQVNSANFSPNGKKIVTASDDKTAKIWDAETGKLLAEINGHSNSDVIFIITVNSANFSPDGKKIVTASSDKTAKIWDAETGKLLVDLTGHYSQVYSANFSPDGKKIVTTSYDKTAKIWDAESGKLLSDLIAYGSSFNLSDFSPDGKKIVTASWDTAKIWDTETGKVLALLAGHSDRVNSANFSPDGRKIVTASMDNTTKIWDVETGKLLADLVGHSEAVYSANFSPNGKKIVTASSDNTSKIWDTESGVVLYTFFAIDNMDYLVVDKEGRFDGTEVARKMLYYVCGTEVIDLDQIKDLCWEPGLVEKIMGTNKEPIKAKRLDEISICGNSPVIENLEEDKDLKKFKIKRRGGGIGELAIYINRKEVEKIPLSSLVFTNDEAIVSIDAEKYKNYFEDGKENSIQLQARTADLSISAKGAVIQVKTNAKPTTAPNLYAIIAGVSDYKGYDLDLKFAAKDAEDFSNALQQSARKLLNIDGKEHVFLTTLVSNSQSSPSKSNISKAFADIKNKANANDIVVIYLSGHGENYGTESTNFYYLTEEASSFELSGIEKEVAISTNEFAEWLKAIPAGKQVLILDACASGKLAEDMLIAMRAGIPSDQIRALDRLNSRTGTFILSGAAANQSAYETSIYGQGLLTYSLLYGMKSGTALKDNQFVDVDKLFQYSADKVKELAAGIGGIQDPVITKPNGGASFDIGKIDETVASKIVLALPKPIFTNSKFSNRETDDDNLGLEKAIDNLLNEYASKGKESKLVFTERSQLPESYKLVGSYQVINNVVEITMRLKKGNTEIQKFELRGDSLNTEKLALEMIERVKTFLN